VKESRLVGPRAGAAHGGLDGFQGTGWRETEMAFCSGAAGADDAHCRGELSCLLAGLVCCRAAGRAGLRGAPSSLCALTRGVVRFQRDAETGQTQDAEPEQGVWMGEDWVEDGTVVGTSGTGVGAHADSDADAEAHACPSPCESLADGGANVRSCWRAAVAQARSQQPTTHHQPPTASAARRKQAIAATACYRSTPGGHKPARPSSWPAMLRVSGVSGVSAVALHPCDVCAPQRPLYQK
jgi:hypothetical protein